MVFWLIKHSEMSPIPVSGEHTRHWPCGGARSWRWQLQRDGVQSLQDVLQPSFLFLFPLTVVSHRSRLVGLRASEATNYDFYRFSQVNKDRAIHLTVSSVRLMYRDIVEQSDISLWCLTELESSTRCRKVTQTSAQFTGWLNEYSTDLC